MEVIKSEEGDSSSKADQDEPSEFNKIDEDDEEDIDRFEEINIKNLDIMSPSTTGKSKKQKALLSQEEIEMAHRLREEDLSSSNRTQVEYKMQCKDFIESGKYNLDDFKNAMGK